MAVAAQSLKNLTPGRKGQPTKLNTDIRKMVEVALSAAGGAEYLTEQAHKTPTAFLGLVGKLLPKDVKVELSIDGQSLSTVLLERREQLAQASILEEVIDAEVITNEPVPDPQPASVGGADTGAGPKRRVRKVRRKKSSS